MNARRLVLSIFATVVGVLMFSSAPALAAPPEAPVTGKATAVTATSALLGGVLNPHAAGEAGFYYFVYAPRGAACTEYGASAEAISAGFEKELVAPPVEIAGLEPSTLYMFCLVDRDEAGATVGSSETFTTLPASPTVEGEAASGVSSTAGTLEGQVNPNNQVTSCEIQYGTTNAYGTKAPCEPASLEGFGNQRAALSVTGLTPGTIYHFRIVAENAGKEKTEGPDQTVTTVPMPNTDPVSAIAARTATLNGHLTLNPVDTQYSFDYKIGTECMGENATPTEDAGSGSGTLASPAVPVTGLIPAMQYSVCFVTSNVFGSETGPAVTFTTPTAPPTITGESVTEDSATAVKLNAQVDPGGAETTYHFEYDTSPYTTSAPHGQSTPESPSIGADNSLHPATAAIQGLQPDTTYHYRIVATNSQSPAGGTDGPDQTFTTETTGGEFALPDGRGYELVSPSQKDGAEVLGIGGGGFTLAAGGATEASEDGTSVTYLASAPVGASPPGNLLSTQMFSTRGAGGWSSLDIATPHKHAIGVDKILSFGEEYLRFSSDLSQALLVPLHETLEPPLAPEIHQEVGGETEIYLRNNATSTFRALVTAEPLPKVEFEGATPDLSHVVFGSHDVFGHVGGGPVGLDPNYPNAEGLYEWADGQTRLVSVLPDRQPANGLLGSSPYVGAKFLDVSATRHAISDDGTRVVWSYEEGSVLFTRDMATGETLQVDAVQSGGGVAGGGVFKVANSDGSRVFFTDGNDLVSGAHGGDLYMFEPARPEGKRLTDLTLGVAGAGSGGVNVLEANEAGTSIYIIGSGNTYLLREAPVGSGSWSSTFVTSGLEESPSAGKEHRAAEALQRQAARVSPSGRYLAFMSRRSLTGYDNRDAISGEPDEEVYWYDAETNRLVCASCDPTGARPVGQYDPEVFPGLAMDPATTWEGRWVAAVIPGWTEDGFQRSTGHQPRYLDDSGRLFFTSSDALVPRDVNGRDDVYEYEPVGVGSCQPPSYGQGASVVFNRTLGGCVGLISAGTGNTDSVFFDASASGSDVFFTTQDGLVSQDKDGTADMYDARVCTQTEACPSSLAVSPACTTTDSCRVAPSPQPGIFAAPATATFAGAGNVTPIPSATKKAAKKKTVRCARGKKRSHGRCVRVKGKNTRAKKARNDRRPGR